MAEALTDALAAVEDTPPEAVAPENVAPSYKDNLVGEGKKFAQDEDLAKAYHHANLHIEELKSDLDEYKGGKELLNEVLDEIRNSPSDTSPEASAPPKAPAELQVQTEDVAKLVSDEFSRKEFEVLQKSNVKTSLEKLSEVYGGESQAKAAILKTMKDDPHMKGIIDDLSRKSPDSVVKFVTGIHPPGSIPAGNTPGVDISGSPIPDISGLTWSKCKEIRKDNPTLYKTPVFRKSIEAAVDAAETKGIDFFAT